MLGSLCLWTGLLPVSTWLFSALVKKLIVGLTTQISSKNSKCRHSFQELWVWQEFCSNRHCHFFSWFVLWGIFASLRLPEHHWFLESRVYIFMMCKPSFYYINVKTHPKCGKDGSVCPLGRWMRFCTQCSLGKPVFQCPLCRAHGHKKQPTGQPFFSNDSSHRTGRFPFYVSSFPDCLALWNILVVGLCLLVWVKGAGGRKGLKL